jgi:hypothetical protein
VISDREPGKLTSILVLLGERPIPRTIPIIELAIRLAQDVESVVIDRPVNRVQIIVDTFPDSHQF